jgi:hypothetical protein
MATFINGESLSSVRTKINDAIDKVDGNAAFSNDISVSGNITVTGTVDGRDVATDGTKLDGIEASATADQTGAEIKSLYEAEADTNAFTDAEQTKLSGIEALADVTDTANVTAAGALMDSELTSEASVKALDQGVATTDSPTFAGLTTTADVTFGDSDKAIFGAGGDLQIYHDTSSTYGEIASVIADTGAGPLKIAGGLNGRIELVNSAGDVMLQAVGGEEVNLYYNNNIKLATTSAGVDVTGDVNLSGSVDFGDWTITESGGSLYFATGGTNKMKLDASGNLQVVGNVEANATIS